LTGVGPLRTVEVVRIVVGALLAAASLATSARPARATSKLDDATAEAFAGTYAVDCRKASGIHVVVAADTLAVEVGQRRIESHDVQKALTFAGGSQPADYRGTLLGDVPKGEPLVFQTYRDAKGVYLVIDADVGLQAAFGKTALTGKFRSCDAAARSAPSAKSAPKPAKAPK
jgi:hypothetical protein